MGFGATFGTSRRWLKIAWHVATSHSGPWPRYGMGEMAVEVVEVGMDKSPRACIGRSGVFVDVAGSKLWSLACTSNFTDHVCEDWKTKSMAIPFRVARICALSSSITCITSRYHMHHFTYWGVVPRTRLFFDTERHKAKPESTRHSTICFAFDGENITG